MPVERSSLLCPEPSASDVARDRVHVLHPRHGGRRATQGGEAELRPPAARGVGRTRQDGDKDERQSEAATATRRGPDEARPDAEGARQAGHRRGHRAADAARARRHRRRAASRPAGPSSRPPRSPPAPAAACWAPPAPRRTPTSGSRAPAPPRTAGLRPPHQPRRHRRRRRPRAVRQGRQAEVRRPGEGITVPPRSTVPVLLSTLTDEPADRPHACTSAPAPAGSAPPSRPSTTSSAATGWPPSADPAGQPRPARHPQGRHLRTPGRLRARRARRRPEGAAGLAVRADHARRARDAARQGRHDGRRRPRRRHQGRGGLPGADADRGRPMPRSWPRCGSSAARAPSRRRRSSRPPRPVGHARDGRRQPRQGLHPLPGRARTDAAEVKVTASAGQRRRHGREQDVHGQGRHHPGRRRRPFPAASRAPTR